MSDELNEPRRSFCTRDVSAPAHACAVSLTNSPPSWLQFCRVRIGLIVVVIRHVFAAAGFSPFWRPDSASIVDLDV